MTTKSGRVYGCKEFWIKGEEARLMKERELRVIVREDDRSDQTIAPKRWLPLMRPIAVAYIAVSGDQAKGIPPKFEEEDGPVIRVVRRTVTRLGDVVDADLHFDGGRAVPEAASEVKRYLEEELCPGKVFSSDALLTIYWFETV